VKNFRQNRPKYIWKTIVLPGLIFTCMLAVFVIAVYKLNDISLEQDRELTYAALKKATIQCFADEGRYPANVDYLEEKYNLYIDYDRFYVTYDCAAANVCPNIVVTRKNME